MLRAAVYCRISKDAEGRGEGVERQRTDCEKLAERLDVRVVETYIDNDIGASTRSAKPRPRYAAMLAAVEAGDIDVIVAYSNSRLTRRPLEFEALVSLHERTGVRISTVVSGEDNLSTADGQMVARIKASVDTAESMRISERTRRAKKERTARGLPQDGRARYGYHRVWSDAGKVVGYEPDHDGGTAAVLAGLYRDYLAGAGLAVLCRGLAERGIRSPAGKDWSTQTLSHTLCSGFAAGVIRELKTGVEHPGAHEPIIDAATWQAFKDMRETRGERWREVPRARRRWELTGVARCGLCSKSLVLNRSRSGKSDQALCSHYNSTRSCSGVWIKLQTLEDAVWGALSNVLADDWPATPSAGESEADAASTRAAACEREIERLAGLMVKLERRRTEDDIDEATYRALRADYEAERAKAEVDARDARERARVATETADVDWAALVERAEQPLTDVEAALHAETLRRVVREVQVHPDRIEVHAARGGVVTLAR